MTAEIAALKDALGKKKETIRQLSLSMGESKRASQKSEHQLQLQISQQADRLQSMEADAERLSKQLKKASDHEELLLKVSQNHSTKGFNDNWLFIVQQTVQIESLRKELATSHDDMRRLRSQLDEARLELELATKREVTLRTEGEEKLKQIQSKASGLEQEATTARYHLSDMKLKSFVNYRLFF